MGLIIYGLVAVVTGMMLVDVTDTPTTWAAWDVASLVLIIVGAVMVLSGMVVHVRAVNRADR